MILMNFITCQLRSVCISNFQDAGFFLAHLIVSRWWTNPKSKLVTIFPISGKNSKMKANIQPKYLHITHKILRDSCSLISKQQVEFTHLYYIFVTFYKSRNWSLNDWFSFLCCTLVNECQKVLYKTVLG